MARKVLTHRDSLQRSLDHAQKTQGLPIFYLIDVGDIEACDELIAFYWRIWCRFSEVDPDEARYVVDLLLERREELKIQEQKQEELRQWRHIEAVSMRSKGACGPAQAQHPLAQRAQTGT